MRGAENEVALACEKPVRHQGQRHPGMRAAIDPAPNLGSHPDDEAGEEILALPKGEAASARRGDLVQAAKALACGRSGRVHVQGMVTRKGLMSTRAKTPPVT